MRRWKTRLLSITLAIVTVLTTIQLPSLHVNAEVPSTSVDGSLINGSNIVQVELGEGNKTWQVMTEFMTYITWAKVPKADIGDSTPGQWVANQLKSNPYDNIWNYDTTYSTGSGKTDAHGLIVHNSQYFTNMIVNNIGSSGSMPSLISQLNSSHMSSGKFSCTKSIANGTKALLLAYHDGSGTGDSVITQESISGNIHGSMKAIYTMLYKYGGMPVTDYQNALNYVDTGAGDYVFIILTSKLAIPADLRALVGSSNQECNCDLNAHDSTKEGVHSSWSALLVNAGIKTSDLLTRGSTSLGEDKKATSTVFNKTWGDILSGVIAKRSPSAANNLKASGAGDIKFLMPIDYFFYTYGQDINVETSVGSVLGGISDTGSISDVKQNYYDLFSSVTKERALAYLPMLEPTPGKQSTNSISVLFSDEDASGMNTGLASLGMNWALDVKRKFCISPTLREQGSNIGDYAYSNVIYNADDKKYMFGYSYLTVGGVGLRFDVSGETKGNVINLTEGQSSTVTPVYEIRFHYDKPTDLSAIESSHSYTIEITPNKSKSLSQVIQTGLNNIKEVSSVSGPSSIGPKSGAELRTMFETNQIVARYTASPQTIQYGQSLSWPCSFTVKIKDNSTGTEIKPSPVDINNDNKFPGFKSGTSGNVAYGNNYASATAGPIARIPWNQQSGATPRAYSEIVANEVGKQDWNVLQGIPSTENLSISAGGDAFLVGYSGWTYKVGTVQPAGWSNEGAGIAMTSPGTTRTITIRSTITDIWGPSGGNTPCTLSCPGHSYTVCSHVGTVSCSCKGGKSCIYCGATTGCNEVSHGTDNKGNPTDIYCDGVEKSCSHSGSVTFNCSTGTWSGSGATVQSPSNSLVDQRKYTGSCSWECAHSSNKGSGSESYSDTTLVDEGYTTGKGCTCNGSKNHQHKDTDVKTFYVKQYISTWTYRQLCNVKLYGLSKSYVKSINKAVLTNGENESAPAVGLKACMWRAGTGDGLGGYTPGNGRLWFQQFNNVSYHNGSGWKATSATGTNGANTYDYWLGDCTVNITAYADQKVAQSTAKSDTDINAWNASIRSDAGKTDTHKNGAPTSGKDNWESGKYTTGDWLSEGERLAQHLQMVNSWQRANNISYNIVSVSDGLSLAVTDNYAEDITGVMYNIGHTGGQVYLFNYPFTAAEQIHHRNWNAPEGNEFGENGRGSLIKLSDPTLPIGYNGSANEVAPTAGGKLYNATYAYGLAKSKVTPDSFNATGGSTTSQSACYTTPIQPTETGKSGYTSWELVSTSNAVSAESFEGYWKNHVYPNTGSFSYVWKMNGTNISGTAYTTTNSGTGNLASYSNPLVISNIDIFGTAANGKYIPCEVNNTYVRLANVVNDQSDSRLVLSDRSTEYSTQFKNGYGTINEIIIHDPVSVQNCMVISNGAGAYASGVIDESGEDQRTVTANTPEKDKADYYVIGNTIHIAWSDIGDFYSPQGTTMKDSAASQLVVGTGDERAGTNKNTGYKISDRTGYVNSMDTSPWVFERYVKFPFPVSYMGRDNEMKVAAAFTYIPLSEVPVITKDGSKTYIEPGKIDELNKDIVTPSVPIISGVYHDIGGSGATDTLNGFGDGEYIWGLDYEFTILTSAVEAQNAAVEFLTTAINDKPGWVNYDSTDHTNENHLIQKAGMELAAESSVRKTDYVDIVGRIGNLTINDTGDFRFSNLFKKTTDGWLIPGVVRNTDYTTPNLILSTRIDILGNSVGSNLSTNQLTVNMPNKNIPTSHATLSMSNYKGNLGKAGKFYELPINAAINNIEEFQNEQLRPGYDILMDIETIGNYYGTNQDANDNAYFGPDSIEEMNSTIDTRDNKVTIIPHYYLYDPDDSKQYVDINIYSGVNGQRTLLWSNSQLSTTNTNAALYVDLTQESARRNVDEDELKATDIITSEIGLPSYEVDGSTASDFIGTSTKIVLDARNRTFIGSNVYYGNYVKSGSEFENNTGWSQTGENSLKYVETNSNPETLADDHDFLMRSQRWHFSLGLPSSTYITEADTIYNSNQQDAIERSHDRLKAAHPNGVIVCFLEIYAKDPVWELEYNDVLAQSQDAMDDGIKISKGTDLFSDADDVTLYRPGYGATYVPSTPGRTISSKWSLSLVMDAWNTSAQDLDTYGTH